MMGPQNEDVTTDKMETINIDVTSSAPETGTGEAEFQKVRRKGGRKRQITDGDSRSISTAASRPYFPPAKTQRMADGKQDMRKLPVPAHRYSPLKENWMKIFSVIVEHLHLQVRFNLKTRMIEIRTCKETQEISSLQKAADFVQAFIYGFDIDDAVALVRLDDLFIQSFEIQDVKPLKGDHLGRAIGRLAGKGGKTKFTIENVTKTRIVLADRKIHIMGSFQNIQVAKRAVCDLILGSPPSKVYGKLRSYASRAMERM